MNIDKFEYRNQIEAKEGGDQTESDIKKWVIDQIGEKPKSNEKNLNP
jgi:hypothetical protein